jgi:hypothetical protein
VASLSSPFLALCSGYMVRCDFAFDSPAPCSQPLVRELPGRLRVLETYLRGWCPLSHFGSSVKR